MKAIVYHGPGKKAWEDVPDPKIKEPTDVIVTTVIAIMVIDHNGDRQVRYWFANGDDSHDVADIGRALANTCTP